MSCITHFLSPTPPGGIMILPLQGTMLLLGWGRAQCLPSESQQYLMCDGAYGHNNGGPSQRTRLYSPRCREGFFSETGLPNWASGTVGSRKLSSPGGIERAGACKTPARSARGIFFSETQLTDVLAELERSLNDATIAPMPPPSMNTPKTNGSATTPIRGFASTMMPKMMAKMPKMPAPQPSPRNIWIRPPTPWNMAKNPTM